jgi:hypothetical protein
MAATDPLYGPGIATPPTDLAAMPDSLDIVEAEHGGHLHLSYPGEPAWRVPGPQTAALRDALWTALDSKGAPDLGTWATEPQRLRRLPPRVRALRGNSDTVLHLAIPPDTIYNLDYEDAEPVMQAIRHEIQLRHCDTLRPADQ